jgi:DNA-directed RNA polymerase subunit H (RpoH/RPB5)
MSSEFTLNEYESNEEIRISILTNIIKMLASRKWINENNIDRLVKNVSEDVNNDLVYKIKLDVNLSKLMTYEPSQKKDFKEDDVVQIKLFFTKITGKSQQILDFFDQESQHHKILIVDSITDKIKASLLESRLHSEILLKDFMKINLGDVEIGPKYTVLTPDECAEVQNEYGMKKIQMQKMWAHDPASLYMYLKKGQIVSILRNSETSTFSTNYRMIK